SLTHHFERSGVEALRDYRRSRVGPRLARTVPRETHWPLFLSRPTTGTSHRTCGYPLTYPLHASVLDRGAPDRLAADARAEPVPEAERPVMGVGCTVNKARIELRSSGLAGVTRRTVPPRDWFEPLRALGQSGGSVVVRAEGIYVDRLVRDLTTPHRRGNGRY